MANEEDAICDGLQSVLTDYNFLYLIAGNEMHEELIREAIIGAYKAGFKDGRALTTRSKD